MEIITPLSIPFYKFIAPQHIQDDVLEHVQSLKYKPEHIREAGFVYGDYFNEKLFDFFDDSIKKVQQVYYSDDLSFPIVDCWVNKYSTLNYLNKHYHPNSVICGLYYVTNHENFGETIYEAENPWNMLSPLHSNINLLINKHSKPLIGKVKAEAGTLVLFPPSLYHYMNTITSKSVVRYTIAFNTFPSGTISNQQTAKLSLEVISLRKKIGNKRSV
jgi:hypothetical protein